MIEMLIISAVAIYIYLLPMILGKDKPNIIMVSVINVLFGWTIIGWIVAIVMALGEDTREEKLARESEEIKFKQQEKEKHLEKIEELQQKIEVLSSKMERQ